MRRPTIPLLATLAVLAAAPAQAHDRLSPRDRLLLHLDRGAVVVVPPGSRVLVVPAPERPRFALGLRSGNFSLFLSDPRPRVQPWPVTRRFDWPHGRNRWGHWGR